MTGMTLMAYLEVPPYKFMLPVNVLEFQKSPRKVYS